MNWTIYGIECAASVALFTGAIMIPLCRNPVWWIHDYPADIQEKYYETHERIQTEPLSAPVLLKKGFVLLLCVGSICGTCAACGRKGLQNGVSRKLRAMARGGLVRLLLFGLGAVRQCQAHPSARNGRNGSCLSPEEISCDSLAQRHGAGAGPVSCLRLDRSGGFVIP